MILEVAILNIRPGASADFERALAEAQPSSSRGEAARYPITSKVHNGEWYFDTDQIELIYQR
jgi:hypothetical protein